VAGGVAVQEAAQVGEVGQPFGQNVVLPVPPGGGHECIGNVAGKTHAQHLCRAPATMAYGGTSRVTTELLPTTAPCPMRTPGMITTP